MSRLSGHHEKIKEQSGKGFDTKGNLMKTIIKIAIAAAIIIAAVYVYTHFDDFGAGIGGGQRNCILSVMGNPPDCSDNDGNLKSTYANGKYVGECYGLDSSGKCIQ